MRKGLWILLLGLPLQAQIVATNTAGSTPSTVIATSTVCAPGAEGTANSVCLGSSTVTGEGATADTSETILAFGDATSDNTLTLKGTASGVEATVTTGLLLTGAGTGTGRVSVGGVLCKAEGSFTTAGTSEEVVATCTIPANTVAAGGSLEIDFVVFTAANANNKTFQVKMNGTGGTSFYSTTSIALNNGTFQPYGDCRIRRRSSTAASGSCSGIRTPGVVTNNVIVDTTAITWANSNTVDFTLTTPTSAGDATLAAYSVRVVQ